MGVDGVVIITFLSRYNNMSIYILMKQITKQKERYSSAHILQYKDNIRYVIEGNDANLKTLFIYTELGVIGIFKGFLARLEIEN